MGSFVEDLLKEQSVDRWRSRKNHELPKIKSFSAGMSSLHLHLVWTAKIFDLDAPKTFPLDVWICQQFGGYGSQKKYRHKHISSRPLKISDVWQLLAAIISPRHLNISTVGGLQVSKIFSRQGSFEYLGRLAVSSLRNILSASWQFSA